MFLALESPDALLERVNPLADFDWILAHKVIDSTYLPYTYYYKHSNHYKVLDNSVNELLEPVSLEHMKAAAEKTSPDIIVAPDFLLDMERTLESLIKCEEIFTRDRVLPVVQGSTINECVECTSEILGRNYTAFAVPFDLACTRQDTLEKMAMSRLAFINRINSEILSEYPLSIRIHLLGLTMPEELDTYSKDWMHNKHVFSIDTGSPILHGLSHILLEEGPLLSKSTPTMRQMEKAGIPMIGKNLDGALSYVYRNLAYLRKKMSGEIERS